MHDLAPLNVDAKLLERRAASLLDLGPGCSCCATFKQSAGGAVRQSLELLDEGRLDYLVVELSGAADPRQLIAMLEQEFGAFYRARLDAVVAVVDADAWSSDTETAHVDERQARARWLLLGGEERPRGEWCARGESGAPGFGFTGFGDPCRSQRDSLGRSRRRTWSS